VKRAQGRSRSPQRDLDPWDRVQVRAVAEDLKSVANRAKLVATSLEKAPAGEDRRRTRRRLEVVRKQIASFAGELLGLQLRLQWIGEGMLRAGPPAAESTAEDDLDATEQMLATIQCVLTDRLAPGIAALVEAAGYGTRDGGKKR